MSSITLQTRAVQATVFSPRLQQAVRLLQMSSHEYAQALRDAAYSNPFIELDENAGLDAERCGVPQALHVSSTAEWATEGSVSSPGAIPFTAGGQHWPMADNDFDALQHLPVPTSLKTHLLEQLGVLRLTQREQAMVNVLVESLDDGGYLGATLDEIGAMLGETSDDARQELRTALRRIQALDPCGVAARDVGECLRLQLAALPESPQRQLAILIVEEHMAVLATRDPKKLMKVTNRPLAQVQAALACIRSLNARPGSRYASTCAEAVTPDVTVRKVRGQWIAVLNSNAVPQVKLHKTYAALFEKQRSVKDHAAMKGCLDQARWTVQHATQRVSTILEVTQAIVARQKLFLEWGPLAMKPLGLQEIADAVGVHPSTVSRTVHNKYMSTPAGVYELQYFFSRGLEHASAGASAPVALQELLRELIAAEPPTCPLSDAALARELARQGFRIARRTVTKYRQSMRIDPVELRRTAGMDLVDTGNGRSRATDCANSAPSASASAPTVGITQGSAPTCLTDMEIEGNLS